ncbi:MerR family DNA-binding protein [Mesorhizobium sp. M0047]|uniref:MerR family DNA-binding protein n=1 Tax=Mesorhizobium sp. M0047 TaxID=2956859 RepID=UPI00333612CA
MFDPAVLERLALIALGRAGGFALDEISAMLTPDGLPKMDRGRLDAKANELDQAIQRLTAIREALRHAARCPAARPMECSDVPPRRQACRRRPLRGCSNQAVQGGGGLCHKARAQDWRRQLGVGHTSGGPSVATGQGR